MSTKTLRCKEVSYVKNGSVEEQYPKQKEKHKQRSGSKERLSSKTSNKVIQGWGMDCATVYVNEVPQGSAVV